MSFSSSWNLFWMDWSNVFCWWLESILNGLEQCFFCWWLESILNGMEQCHFLVVGIYFEWNGTMSLFCGWNLFWMKWNGTMFFFSGGWNLFWMEWNNVIFLVLGFYFEWNGTMSFSGGWNLFSMEWNNAFCDFCVFLQHSFIYQWINV
jgi:hypothetical protein